MADMFHWRTLTEAINQIPTAPSFIVDRIFRTQEQALAEDIDVDITIGNKKLAPFVSPVEAGVVVDTLGRKMRTVKAPRLRPKKVLNAQDLLTVRGAGGNLYVAGGGDINAARERKLATELQDLQNIITRAKEWMASQALQGKLTVSQENVAFEVDFLLPSTHKPVLTGTDLWTDTTNSDPVAKIRELRALIANATGLTADIALCGTSVVDALVNHPKVQKVLNTQSGIQVGNMILGAGNYVGRLVGVDIYEYSAKYTNSAGVDALFIPDDAFILVASAGPFRMHHAIILDLDTNAVVASPFFAKSWIEKDPSAQWLLAESRPLPVPHWPECIVFATVI